MCRHCWQPIHLFYYPISCLHLCLANIKFFIAFFKSTTLSFLVTFAHLSSLIFHDCKRENFSFWSRILITIWTVIISFSICLLQLSFIYSLYNWLDPLIGVYTSIDCVTWSYWVCKALSIWICTLYDLPDHWFYGNA